MQRILNTLHRRSRLLWWCSLAIAALVITGCGPLGDDEADPTATADTISQPIVATDEAPDATPANQFVPPVATESTPAAGLSTPVVTEPTLPPNTVATPEQPDISSTGTPVVNEATQPASETAVASSSGAVFTGSDGTSGAVPGESGPTEASVDPVASAETPTPTVASVSATPMAGATPEVVGLGDQDPLSVTSCVPEAIPQLISDQTEYLTSSDVNFRTGPGADCDTIGDGPIGVNIPVTVLSGPVIRTDIDDPFVWVQVQIASETGWVVLEVLEPAP
ncbi:MAG: hypothetical protein H0T72_11180 [Chloroflexia bacterium]|nr:hypothetical protein [Chloroflexia bacterium]